MKIFFHRNPTLTLIKIGYSQYQKEENRVTTGNEGFIFQTGECDRNLRFLHNNAWINKLFS